MARHPELELEQAHVDRAYLRLDQLRSDAEELLRSVLDQGRGGTHQFREERDVIVRTSLARIDQLDIGEQALCFGRIDQRASDPELNGNARGPVESFHIGRLGISGEDLEPLVVDWRAPVAEPFYRATGRDPMGLVLRRHLAAQGREIIGIEDERFGADDGTVSDEVRSGDSATVLDEVRSADGNSAGLVDVRGATADGPSMNGEAVLEPHLDLGGPGALLAALQGTRTGFMRDIVSTIQREQDEIIRAPLPGVMVVQGGPGTGKTAVALHRAAYLLYTHRFPLERQGVLVIGPNPLFLRYIEQVLPSLGESGVTLSTVSGLVHGFEVRSSEPSEVAKLKGDARMADVIARAVRTRQRALRQDVEIPFGSAILRLRAEDTAAVVAAARRRPGSHNRRRRFVEQLVVRRLADDYTRLLSIRTGRPVSDGGEDVEDHPASNIASNTASNAASNADANGHSPDSSSNGRPSEFELEDSDVLDIAEFSREVRRTPELAEALDRMWPRLSAEELLHDLLGARPLLQLASKGILTHSEQNALYRPRSTTMEQIPWTAADAALIDEARMLLGSRRGRTGSVTTDSEDSPRTYGHIVVDEAQDLSPMQVRMVARRSLSGSVTVVGDVAQATGPWAPAAWSDLTVHLPSQRPASMVELTVSYRTPAEVVDVAERVLAEAAPGVRAPRPVRRTGQPPRFEHVTSEQSLADRVAYVAGRLVDEVSPGTAAVLAPASLIGELALALDSAGVAATDP
ncbi:MAG TPA: hypothetical protein VEJ87_08860, partial [Acidimicrobiales bacterium]|nr:hypothetical protein [Acidimicrobiales bacterium]